MEKAIDLYLQSKVFWGESEFSEKDEIKSICLKTARYDKESKRWGTVSLFHALQLMQRKIWRPSGIDDRWLDAFTAEVQRRIREKDTEREAKAIDLSEKKRKESTPVQTGPTMEEKQAEMRRRQRHAEACTPEEKEACAALGLSEEVVQRSSEWGALAGDLHLGPHAGLSPSARVLRLVRLQENAARLLGTDVAAAREYVVRVMSTTQSEVRQPVKKVKKEEEAVPTGPAVVVVKQEAASEPVQRKQAGKMKQLAPTQCPKCNKIVNVQFSCCGCFGASWHEKWTVCRVCDRMVNPVLKRSSCEHV